MSTRQQDSGPVNPPKRLGPRLGSTPSAPPADQAARSLPSKPAPRSATTPVAAVVTRPDEEANDPISRLRRSLDGIRAEVMKVTWPTRQETINLTIVVIGLSAFVGVTLGIFDAVMAELVKFLTTGTIG